MCEFVVKETNAIIKNFFQSSSNILPPFLENPKGDRSNYTILCNTCKDAPYPFSSPLAADPDVLSPQFSLRLSTTSLTLLFSPLSFSLSFAMMCTCVCVSVCRHQPRLFSARKNLSLVWVVGVKGIKGDIWAIITGFF